MELSSSKTTTVDLSGTTNSRTNQWGGESLGRLMITEVPWLSSDSIFRWPPHFSIEVLLIREEEVWCDDGQGSWRRKHWSIQDRHLLEVMQAVTLTGPADFAPDTASLPPSLL